MQVVCFSFTAEFSSINRRLLSGDKTTAETEDISHSTTLDPTLQSQQSCQETSLVHNESETNDINSISSPNVPHDSFSVNMSSKTDDVIQKLVTKFNQLVAYSSDLQVQLTVREDETDRLAKENANLIKRLECCKKIAEAVEESNLARVESERRAIRAERELIGLKQRIEELERLNRMHESRLANNDCYSSTRNSAYDSIYELQPRGKHSG